jgi:hypothetical protein
MNAGVGGQLVEVFEVPDVADLGDEGGGQRRPDADADGGRYPVAP